MGKRRRAATRTTTKIVRVGSPAPIIRVAAPRAAPVRRRRRSHSGGGGGRTHGGLVSGESVQAAIGGLFYGLAVKSGLVAKLPAIPVIGRTGTAALALDYWGRHGGGRFVRSAAHAAAAIAGYQLGAEGTIQGDFAMGADDATTPGSVNADLDGYGDPRQAPGES